MYATHALFHVHTPDIRLLTIINNILTSYYVCSESLLYWYTHNLLLQVALSQQCQGSRLLTRLSSSTWTSKMRPGCITFLSQWCHCPIDPETRTQPGQFSIIHCLVLQGQTTTSLYSLTASINKNTPRRSQLLPYLKCSHDSEHGLQCPLSCPIPHLTHKHWAWIFYESVLLSAATILGSSQSDFGFGAIGRDQARNYKCLSWHIYNIIQHAQVTVWYIIDLETHLASLRCD